MAGLHYIQEQLTSYKTKLAGRGALSSVFAVSIGVDEICCPDTLYIFNWQTQHEAIKKCLSKECNIMVFGTDDESLFSDALGHVLIIHQMVDAAELMVEIQNILTDEQRVATYVQRLFSMLIDGEKLQTLIDYTYAIMRNPIFVIDPGFCILAANWEAEQGDDRSLKISERRYFSSEDMQAINFSSNSRKKLSNADKPTLIKNPMFDKARLIISIKVGGKEAGFISVTESERSFSPLDYKLLTALRDVISQYFQKNEFVHNNKGSSYEYLLADLLDGTSIVSKELDDRLIYADLQLKDMMYVIVADLSKSSKCFSFNHQREAFEQIIPGSRALMYNGQIVLLIIRRKDQPMSLDEVQSFREYCREAELYCGLSINFSSISDLSRYYMQALRALEFGMLESNEPYLYRYVDYSQRHMTELLLSHEEDAKAFIHYTIQVLREYDEKNNVEFCYTLYSFLICERCIATCAGFLHIHRNTLTYRLKKIFEIISVDLNDWKKRQHIITSYQISSELQRAKKG